MTLASVVLPARVTAAGVGGARLTWTHSDVAVLLKAVQTAYLLQQEEFAEPQPGIEAMLDRWDKAVEDFIAEPGSERMGPLRVCMRELVEFVW